MKISRQMNKERSRHARKTAYIHTKTKVFINNYLEKNLVTNSSANSSATEEKKKCKDLERR